MIMPGTVEDHDDAVRLQGRAEPAVAAVVDQQQGEADDDRRDRHRQVDQGRERPLAGELVAHEEQRHPDAEDGVDRDRPQRDLDGDDHGVHDVGVGERGLEAGEAVGEGVLDQRDHRPADEQEHVGDDDEAQRPLGGRGKPNHDEPPSAG